MKKKILILATGGTIASGDVGHGFAPAMAIGSIIDSMVGVNHGYALEARDILRLDSSNIQPEDWLFIAREIDREMPHYDGILVTHGTDTMAYTASMLSFVLQNLKKPVVLTGSQLPFSHPLSDARANVCTALAMAASGAPGVFLAFDRYIIRGCRAVKVRTVGFDAFESINAPVVGTINTAGLSLREELLPTPTGDYALRDQICGDVFLIKLTPGLNPRIFSMLQSMNYKGVVIEAFGAGGLAFIHRDLTVALRELTQAGIPVVVASQCLYEPSDLSIYEVGRRALESGVISARDMTTEAAVTKLMWALGQSSSLPEIRKIFATDYCGEIQTITPPA